jgi:predicted O-methyltransferase YrrM
LAWVAQHLLDKDATIVDVDLENDIEAESRVRAELDSGKNYHCIEGNSISDEVLERVRGVFPKPEVDLIFLDSNHMYFHFLNEVDRYLPLLKPGGFLLAHDVCWEGSEKQKGKAQACELIDRHLPIFLVNGNAPVTRFMRLQKNDPSWGCVGIIQKPYEVSK